jgi:starch synthase
VNRRKLQERFGVAGSETALVLGVVSRLSWQKGLDLLLEALPDLLRLDAQLVVLGTGDAAIERAFRDASVADPDHIGLIVGYDEALAHLVQGGSDALLVPSRFEPCGLTQLCAMRYGSLPIVSRVGGLNDTVIDASEMALSAGVATGFQFGNLSGEGLAGAVSRAFGVWKDQRAWRRMQSNGMSAELGWDRPAGTYIDVYRAAIASQGRPLARSGWRRGTLPDQNHAMPKKLAQKQGPPKRAPPS